MNLPKLHKFVPYSFVLVLTLLGFIALTQRPVLGKRTQDIQYGADPILGPVLEPCVTDATVPGATVVDPEQEWEQILRSAQPGATILFHGGTYQGSDKLWLPAGAAGAPIMLQPYNCEAVILYTSLRPLSYTVIAGLTLQAQDIADQDYVIRIDSEYKGEYWGNITQVTIRNNRIYGGMTDAVRISDDIANITITGNLIDGGATGHNIFVTSEKHLQQPDQILITNNKLTKRLFDTPAEDMFQVRDVGYVAFTFNTCTDGVNMEQCVDIKTTTTPLLIANNFFDGAHLHVAGTGEDKADGCMVIHESDEVAEQHLIEHNYFNQCKGAAIRFAAGEGEQEIGSGIVRYNLFLQTSDQQGALSLFNAHNVLFLNNTMICGRFKLGNSAQTSTPSNTTIKNNIFYKTSIEDHTSPSNAPYSCSYNLFYATRGSGFVTSGCVSSSNVDPQFVGATIHNFHLQSTSPALSAGEGGVHLGAFSWVEPPVDLPFQFYLPVVVQIPPFSSELACQS
ncbi:MAG: hypothetical protein R3E79_49075 [Caldilineaceae bacterium]